jgi:hypothetical protein
LSIGEHRVDIKDHATEWVLAVTQYLADVVFRVGLEHGRVAPFYGY